MAILMAVIGGLGIFMLGMKHMSEGMQAVAGNSLRRMISLVTTNRFLATATGAGVTTLVQSSSVTTVIVVGLVNAGLMQLQQAIGVIFGANIGTTITGWILVLNIGKYGLPILGAAALVYLFARRDRTRFIAMALMGMGMVFFGLELMKNGFAPVKDMPVFMEAFQWFEADSYAGIYKAVFVGCVLTLIVQSSSATLGITIGLAATGVIPFQTAAALVLGENIGTTITIVLASFGANTNAKRAALAHVLFNLIGAFWITLVFPWYIKLVAGTVAAVHGADPLTLTLASGVNPVEFATVVTAAIALTHSGFNIVNTAVFLPFIKPYTRMLERLVPDPRLKEVARLTRIDAGTVASPVLGLEQSRGEVIQMAQGTLKMMEWIRQLGFHGPWDELLVRKTFHREEVLDNVQREVVAFLTSTLDSTMPQMVAEEGRQQLRIAHEYESVSDRAASILRAFAQLRQQRLELRSDQQEDLQQLHAAVTTFLQEVSEAYGERTTIGGANARSHAESIDRLVRMLSDRQLQRMIDGPIDPGLSLVYTGLITDYSRIRSHVRNIHDAMAGGGVPE
ncbi:MAG: Na/Pi cotransporter family protein [Gemmatimonadaceae bacterium]|nr:Na/Pi cotransporter family protein [Gemmatimonadaceae bacterium]MCW5826260.1 Na/Pi cotransporter family protein [Gemmatimonadaceae bacterium]